MKFDQFQIDDPKHVFNDLVNRALAGKQSNFEFIRSRDMLTVAKAYKSGTKKLAKFFKKMATDLFKQYANKIISSAQDVEALLAVKQFEVCHKYYTNEFNLAKDMLSEYRAYTLSGHILDQYLFNRERTDEECIDYRKLPFRILW